MAKRDEVNLREFCMRYRKGEYDSPDFDTQVRAGWYDWFCGNEELLPRLRRLWLILSRITNPYLLDNYYVWFKNNCPAMGPLYDDIRFEPLDGTKRQDLYFVLSIDDKRQPDRYCIYTARNRYGMEASFNKPVEVIGFLNSWNPETEEARHEIS